MNTKHTSTPWKANRNRVEAGPYGIAACYGFAGAEGNAAFIVKAVNCHEELLTLLKLMLEENPDTGYKFQAIQILAKAEEK